MAYIYLGQTILPQGIGEVSGEAKLPLGMKIQAYDSALGYGEFLYLEGVVSTVKGSFVRVTGEHKTALSTATASPGCYAVATAAIVASKYGWYQVTGRVKAKSAANVAEDVLLATDAGRVKAGAGSAASDLLGAISVAADDSGEIEILMQHPVRVVRPVTAA